MSDYATLDELREYTDLDDAMSGDDAQKLLDRAERDVDGILAVRSRDTTTGLRVVPADLEPWQAAALSRATCAQAEYRLAMGEEFFVRPQHKSVRGPEFSTDGRLPYIGPKVLRELDGTGLARGASGSIALTSDFSGTGTATSLVDFLLP